MYIEHTHDKYIKKEKKQCSLHRFYFKHKGKEQTKKGKTVIYRQFYRTNYKCLS